LNNRTPATNNKKLNVFRLLRIARDIKVPELAKTLKVTSAYINAIEKGERTPSERLLRDYAKALNVSEDLIITFSKEKQTTFEKTLLHILDKICNRD
jgi:transcriptional regulator with XRE-family HTH domain